MRMLFLIFLFASQAFGQAALRSPNRALDQDRKLCVNDGGAEKCLTVDGPTAEVVTPGDLDVTGNADVRGMLGVVTTDDAKIIFDDDGGGANEYRILTIPSGFRLLDQTDGVNIFDYSDSTDTTTFAGSLTVVGTTDPGTLADGSVSGGTGGQIVDESVTSADIDNGTIDNVDINAGAAIAGSKIDPDFSAQDVTTTGDMFANMFDADDGTGDVGRLRGLGGGGTAGVGSLAVGRQIAGTSCTTRCENFGSCGCFAAVVNNVDGLSTCGSTSGTRVCACLCNQ